MVYAKTLQNKKQNFGRKGRNSGTQVVQVMFGALERIKTICTIVLLRINRILRRVLKIGCYSISSPWVATYMKTMITHDVPKITLVFKNVITCKIFHIFYFFFVFRTYINQANYAWKNPQMNKEPKSWNFILNLTNPSNFVKLQNFMVTTSSGLFFWCGDTLRSVYRLKTIQ